MWQEIGLLAATDKMTVLLTTHYLEEADRLADRVAIVDHGRVVAEGEPEELKQELKGDVIHIELPDGASRREAEHALSGIPAIRDVYVADGSVSGAQLRRGRGRSRGPRQAHGRRNPAKSVAVARPSLDEVYLRYACCCYTEVNV